MVKIVGMLLSVVSLAVLGLVGYGLASGRLDGQARGQYLATWRKELLVAPAMEESASEEEGGPSQASERIATLERQREILSREQQRDLEALRGMQATLASSRATLDADERRLAADKAAFEEQLARYNERAREVGFQKALKNYTLMKAKLVRDDFMKMTDEEVVRYVGAMRAETSKKIFETFKTAQEQEKRLRVLGLLKQSEVIELSRNEQ